MFRSKRSTQLSFSPTINRTSLSMSVTGKLNYGTRLVRMTYRWNSLKSCTTLSCWKDHHTEKIDRLFSEQIETKTNFRVFSFLHQLQIHLQLLKDNYLYNHQIAAHMLEFSQLYSIMKHGYSYQYMHIQLNSYLYSTRCIVISTVVVAWGHHLFSCLKLTTLFSEEENTAYTNMVFVFK